MSEYFFYLILFYYYYNLFLLFLLLHCVFFLFIYSVFGDITVALSMGKGHIAILLCRFRT